MSARNRVQLIGNLGKDPEIRTLQNGGKVATFSVATSEQWRDKSTGERKERTEWHNIAIFAEGLVTIAERYLRKGSKVCIVGKMQTRKWQDNSGADRWSTEVVLQPYDGEMVLLGDPGGGNRPPPHEGDDVGGQQPAGKKKPTNDLDDDIPF